MMRMTMMPAVPSTEMPPMQMSMAMAMLVFRINSARFLSHRVASHLAFGALHPSDGYAVQTVYFGMFD